MLQAVLFALTLTVACSARAEESWVHTRDVSAMIVFDGALWVASSGGLERYAGESLAERTHLTLDAGLDALEVLALGVEDGALVARTARSRCTLEALRVHCRPSELAPPRPALSGRVFQGAALVSELPWGEGKLVATRGLGVWYVSGREPRRITPDGQICTNHVQSLAVYKDALWIGGFRDGLCVYEGDHFVALATPFRFVNALLTVDDTLYVAAHEGLFRTRDGHTFESVPQIRERGVNGLARGSDALYVTTPAALFRLPLMRGRLASWWQPGGSSAIQGVSVRGDEVWLASEDRGALHVRGREIEVFDALRGLDSSWVVDVTSDDHGTAYAATLKHGLFSITRDGHVQRHATHNPWLLKLAHVSGRLCVASQSGFSCEQANKPAAPALLAGRSVHAFMPFAGQLWVGTESGLVALPSSS